MVELRPMFARPVFLGRAGSGRHHAGRHVCVELARLETRFPGHYSDGVGNGHSVACIDDSVRRLDIAE